MAISPLHELKRSFLYFIAGVGAVPAGIAYGVLSLYGYDRWWTAVPAVLLGVVFAAWLWKRLDWKLFGYRYKPLASGALDPEWDGQSGIMFEVSTVVNITAGGGTALLSPETFSDRANERQQANTYVIAL